MEKVIDRREYRRNSENEKSFSDEQINVLQKRIKKFLLQSLCTSTFLLLISILKVNGYGEILSNINYHLDSEITLSSLQERGQIIFQETNKYYMKLNSFIENLLQEKSNVINNFSKISGDNILNNQNENIIVNAFAQNNNSGESVQSSVADFSVVEYESAVEGINQMSEDAKYINENYDFTIPVVGTITSVFGVRNSSNPKVSPYHAGLDIAANVGTQVLAAIEGEVIEAGTDTYYGKYLKIKKDEIIMIYAHCSKLLVQKGDTVKKGNLIAYVGNTGNSTGPHLHFEIKYQDRLVNPSDILGI